MKKLPPTEKVYEAFSAIADGRVTLGDGQASIASSNGDKSYSVTWAGNAYASDDNATYWQGYAGYPVIAVLMLQGMLPLNKEIAALFSGINWSEANAAAKRDYAKAAEAVFDRCGYDGSVRQRIRAEAERVHEKLAGSDIVLKRAKPKKN